MTHSFEYQLQSGDEENAYDTKINSFINEDEIKLHITILGESQPIDQVTILYNPETKEYTPVNEMSNPQLYGAVILMLDETISEWRN